MHQPATLHRLNEIPGARLRATEGALGQVQDFQFDDGQWTFRHVVANTGNWLIGHRVLVSPSSLGDPNRGRIKTEIAVHHCGGIGKRGRIHGRVSWTNSLAHALLPFPANAIAWQQFAFWHRAVGVHALACFRHANTLRHERQHGKPGWGPVVTSTTNQPLNMTMHSNPVLKARTELRSRSTFPCIPGLRLDSGYAATRRTPDEDEDPGCHSVPAPTNASPGPREEDPPPQKPPEKSPPIQPPKPPEPIRRPPDTPEPVRPPQAPEPVRPPHPPEPARIPAEFLQAVC